MNMGKTAIIAAFLLAGTALGQSQGINGSPEFQAQQAALENSYPQLNVACFPKLTLNSTSFPVTEPFPPELTLILSALATEARAVKLEARTRVRKESCPRPESRDLKATSDGELTRVGTCGVLNTGGPEVRPTSESLGKTR